MSGTISTKRWLERTEKAVKEEVPALWKSAVGIFLSDVHLSDTPPIARSEELVGDERGWFNAMRRPLMQVFRPAREYGLPVVIAGDLFNAPTCSNKLITFCLETFPEGLVYAIPGQHDLPNHQYSEIKRSAYWTLVKAGVLTNIQPGHPIPIGQMILHGFPFGFPITPRDPINTKSLPLDVAVVHEYCWRRDCSYPGASLGTGVVAHRKKLGSYDAAFFGDNHKGFLSQKSPPIMNCGAFIRRAISEQNYQPFFGVLKEDGTIEKGMLDVSQDKWIDLEVQAGVLGEQALNLTDFLGELSKFKEGAIDFRDALKKWLNSNVVGVKVRQLILTALGEESKPI